MIRLTSQILVLKQVILQVGHGLVVQVMPGQVSTQTVVIQKPAHMLQEYGMQVLVIQNFHKP